MNKEQVENQIVHQALEGLERHTGLNAKWKSGAKNQGVEGMLTIELPCGKVNLNAEVKRTMRQQQLPAVVAKAKANALFILIAEELFPKIKEQLRQHQICYLDGAGNLYLNTAEKFVWIEGNKLEKAGNGRLNRAFTKTGLKVIFYLLTDEKALSKTYREIAAGAGVALGNISLVLNGLKGSGFLLQLSKREVVLHNKKVLLDKWVDGYRNNLKPALYIGEFNFGSEGIFEHWGELTLLPEDNWGGEAGAEITTNYLKAEQLTLYTQHDRAEIMRNWKLVPAKGGGLKVYQKFWLDKGDAANIVPHLLTYADLVSTDDPRCLEAAEIIYNTHLAKLLNAGRTTKNGI